MINSDSKNPLDDAEVVEQKLTIEISPRRHGKTMEARREYQKRINAPELDRIFTGHSMLHQSAKDNAEVYAWLKMAAMGKCTVEEALIGALVRLADTNQKQFDEIVAIKYRQEYPNDNTQSN